MYHPNKQQVEIEQYPLLKDVIDKFKRILP